jgi:glycosyltransferase involved in cell wall biosynthesis
MTQTLNVGIVCYASVGGSGIVATELGKALALRGHQAHFISTETPFRLGDFQEGLFFHQVLTPTYPLFREPQYLLSLANRIVQVARESKLDIIHAHYAVPHATAAFLSRQILTVDGAGPRVVTTLHGTDITLVGSDPSYSRIVALCRARCEAPHLRHPQLPRLRHPSAPAAPGSPETILWWRHRHEGRGARLELSPCQTRGCRGRDLRSHPEAGTRPAAPGW